MDHGVGCTDSALDVKSRVAWAWRAVKSSPAVKRRAITLLSLNVGEGSVNGSKSSELASMLGRASTSAGKVLPALARSWNAAAPNTLRGNISAKLGSFERVKRRSYSSLWRSSVQDSDSDSEDDSPSVEACMALPMTSLQGAKRAAQAMLVAAVFAAELSNKERVPVLVLGRPPGHHATCAHTLALDAAPRRSPGGALKGAHLGGGCFYPSCWLAATHCLRQGMSQRLAYIDVDAHKPDGVWKEVDHLCTLGTARRAAVLNGQPDSCQGLLFASLHVNGYPNPNNHWESVSCGIPKSHKRAFDIMVQEELLPPGVATGELENEAVLNAFKRWQNAYTQDLRSLRPDGLFVGLGLDLHKHEKRIGDKAVGLGLQRQHYRKLIQDLPTTALKGPVVLTLEGGYTKAGVIDGMLGVLSGLEALSHKAKAARRISGSWLHKVRQKCSRKAPVSAAVSSKRRLSGSSMHSSDHQKGARRSMSAPQSPAASSKRRLSRSSTNSSDHQKRARRSLWRPTGVVLCKPTVKTQISVHMPCSVFAGNFSAACC